MVRPHASSSPMPTACWSTLNAGRAVPKSPAPSVAAGRDAPQRRAIA
jgi:hypothetical protein